MPRFKVAHLNQSGQHMVIIPLDREYGYKSTQEQRQILQELQSRSTNSGLRGTVVPVWEQNGRMSFIAPRPWHSFFQSMSLHDVWANINKEIYW